MSKFHIILIIAILHFIIFGFLLLKYGKKDDPKSQGIVFSSIFGFGMSFVYLIESFNL
jgi:ABC-type Mn2+/Zn2+ transport system permease subunit